MIRTFIFMVIMMMPAGTCLAEDLSPCPVDTVPIQIITEKEYHEVTTLSEAKPPNYPEGFTDFVTAVTEHLAAKLGQENLCLNSAESREQSLLQFVPRRMSISNSIPVPSVPPLEVRPLGVCRITSPWMDLTIERKPVPRVNGIVRWSQRQLLADQAVLDGARNVPPGPAEPLKNSEDLKYSLEYLEYVQPSIPGKPAVKPIEEMVPPDLLWLFRRSAQGERLLSSIYLDNAMKAGAAGYTKIVIRLIDQCLASGGSEMHYNSVLDVSDLVPLEEYKIVTPLR